MKTLKCLTTTGLLLAALALATGCDASKNITPQKNAAAPASFGLLASGKLCNLHVKLDKVANGSGPRSLVALAASELCGTQGSGTAVWHAMGMAVSTSSVFVKKPSAAAYDTTAAGELMINDANPASIQVLLHQGNQTVPIGTMKKLGHLEAIVPSPGVSFEIAVPYNEGQVHKMRPYKVSDGKNMPGSTLFVVTDLIH